MDVKIKTKGLMVDAIMEIVDGVILVTPVADIDMKEKEGPITERVKSYGDACKELGREPYDEKKLLELGLTKNDIAYQKMVVIVESLNEGWKPDVCDKNVCRWYPWFRPNGSPGSFAFDDSYYAYESANAGSGSRLALKSQELADYCGEQFVELWKEMLL